MLSFENTLALTARLMNRSDATDRMNRPDKQEGCHSQYSQLPFREAEVFTKRELI